MTVPNSGSQACADNDGVLADAAPAESTSADVSGRAFVFFTNASSGNQDTEVFLEKIATAMQGREHHIVCVYPQDSHEQKQKEAVSLVKKHDAILVVAGGDGTISAMANHAIAQQFPMAIVPFGTFNMFARDHGLSLDTDTALRDLLTGRIQPVQTGEIGGVHFIVNATLGLYSQLLADREQWKNQFGRRRGIAIFAAFSTIMKYGRSYILQFNKGEGRQLVKTVSFMACNNNLQAQQAGVQYEEKMGDGYLYGIVLKPSSRKRMLLLALKLIFRRLDQDRQIISFPFESLDIDKKKGGRSIEVAMDGEVHTLQAPFTVKANKDLLRILMPASMAQQPSQE
ncbi:diacylglycerol kinase family enzyme [Advenella incenata]|jgi:diacylglycerol kinase family enzyme|uniref:Diacylglycerol kinase family enzyme n=1 Tax=Advenella incenata TaxID=267800 RepID=A0A4Q7VBF4_9BURK|nr:diacylglycerol kinase family protein [Advenella incenata]RZT92122.1 diacylglycerol kinase family enzyme [Advenella incenata]